MNRLVTIGFFIVVAPACMLISCASGRSLQLSGPMIVGGIPMTGTTSPASQRKINEAGDGALYVAYVKDTAGVDQLFVATSRDDGESWQEFPQISSGDTGSSTPHLVIDQHGDVIVFWTKDVELSEEELEGQPTGIVGVGDVDISDEEIRTAVSEFTKEEEDEEDSHGVRQLFSSRFNGRRWTPQEQLTSGEYNGVASAAFDSLGVLHLVWYGFDGSFYQIVYSKMERSRWSRPEIISLGFPDSLNPAIAVDSRDNIHVAWYKYNPGLKSYQVMHRMFSVELGRWTVQKQVSTGLFTAINAAIAVSPDDAVHVAYDGDVTATGNTAVYIRELRGDEWTAQIKVSGDLIAERPSVTADSDGKIFVLYSSPQDSQIYLSSSDDWSPSRQTDRAVNSFPNVLRNDWPTFAAGKVQGSVRFVWTESSSAPGEPPLNLLRFGTSR